MHGRPVCSAALVCCLVGAQEIALAFPPGMRVLFQGDSITDCNRTAGSNHTLGDGYAFFVATQLGAASPERNLTFLNRGVSGNTVNDLAMRWKEDTLRLNPDVLSILIGINDSVRQVPLEEFEEGYDRLLAATVSANPKLRLVICEPFALPAGERKAGFQQWFADVRNRQQIAERLAAKYHAPLVRFQKVFDDACKREPPDHWIADGIHPTEAGHQLMADEWIRVVRQEWPD
jgi:lysophospholipase L1-like esterase